VRNLLNAGASPNCSNEDGLTVLHQVFYMFDSLILANNIHCAGIAGCHFSYFTLIKRD